MKKYTFNDLKIGDTIKIKDTKGIIIKIEDVNLKNKILNKNMNFLLENEIQIYVEKENKFYSCNCNDILKIIPKHNKEKTNIISKLKNIFKK